MFRIQFDPGDPKRDAVATNTFDEAWSAVRARHPEAQRQKWWDLVGSTLAPTWENATLKVWPDRAARNKEYVRHQKPGADEPDCLGGAAAAVIVNLSDAPPEPRARLRLQGARCRIPRPDPSAAPVAAAAQGWLGCHVKASFEAGAFKHEWLVRPLSIAVPVAGQRTENLTCPTCGRTVRVAAMSRRWLVVIGLARLGFVLAITLGMVIMAVMLHELAGWPLWPVFVAPVATFALFTWLSHSADLAGPISWTGPLLKPRFTDYVRIAGGRGKAVICLDDGTPVRYAHELYTQAQGEAMVGSLRQG